MVHDGVLAYEFSAWSLHSIALHSPPALLPVSVLAELKPGSCIGISIIPIQGNPPKKVPSA
ncbi:hypothetical protein ALQ87_200164 [Pseudomonas savastanoi pv. glycinea]|nr:hypothetical protein ALQ87_200164 [Pseudomonas savastanoi pv. glycinea]